MVCRFSLKRNNGFEWYCNEKVKARGYVICNNILYTNEEILKCFEDVYSSRDLSVKLRNANGQFAVIINLDNEVIAAVDNSRSIPLFYHECLDTFVISDYIDESLFTLSENSFCDVSINEFLQTGYVVGNHTLLKDFYQLSAGEYLVYNKKENSYSISKYYVHKSDVKIECAKQQHYKNLEKISIDVFTRLIKSLNGRTAVIPLSGGFDSRYIVSMLKKLNYENVICYTYGRSDSFEVDISKKVADTLKYKWYFIKYDEESYNSLIKDKDFIDYFRFASNYSSLSHYQDLLAVKKLHEKKMIPPDSIFIPGFCGDLLGGSYLPQEILFKKDVSKIDICDYIFDRHFNLNYEIKEKYSNLVKTEIALTLKPYNYTNSEDSLVATNDGWFTEHKASKFVVNAVRVFEYYGYEWRLPLWDCDLLNYWYSVPYNYKLVDNKLYNDFLFDFLFIPYQIDFVKKFTSNKRDGIVRFVKMLLPLSLFCLYRKFFQYQSINKSVNSFQILFNYWENEVGKNNKINFDQINQIAAFWQLVKVYNFKENVY
ncbi:asparagine synthase C-terminal domain-containing protein [Acetobacteroides hydrogenigenes]|uniref:asparagine synthase (glutamine-hydrolyzing) n=1 Tax=Acetobacteroides hydrogenigenes TaxID=979970 RepID=A0A4V2RN38_9BACT|nr:asparagine synthase C-terminal domain-containing protein [Acetobacteroides hydrogenigenes]TCN62200.1 asparagine synthase (glutamine-hydrolysing) [Acetobacteroides hydrogenigenes]